MIFLGEKQFFVLENYRREYKSIKLLYASALTIHIIIFYYTILMMSHTWICFRASRVRYKRHVLTDSEARHQFLGCCYCYTQKKMRRFNVQIGEC